VTVLIGGSGLLVSSIGYAGSQLSIELWWAPFGFGLAIASALAGEIGGLLSVAAPPEGGTRVVLRLPRAEPAAEHLPAG
jgi:hypothetical protein